MPNSTDRNFEPATKFRATREQLGTRVDDGTILLNLANGEYFKLNESAELIWEQLKEEQSVADLLRALCSAYDVDESRCQSDLKHILEEMLNAGLIEMAR